MTVRYLRKLHHKHDAVKPLPEVDHNDNDVIKTNDYVAGFSECALQVRRFLTGNNFHPTGTSPCGDPNRKPEVASSDEKLPSRHNTAIDISTMLWHHLGEYVLDRPRHQIINSEPSLDQTQHPENQTTDKTQRHQYRSTVPLKNVASSLSQPGVNFYASNSISTSRLAMLPIKDDEFPVYAPPLLSCSRNDALMASSALLDCVADDKPSLNLPISRVISGFPSDDVIAFPFPFRALRLIDVDPLQSKSEDGPVPGSMWRPWRSTTAAAADSKLERSNWQLTPYEVYEKTVAIRRQLISSWTLCVWCVTRWRFNFCAQI